MLALPPTVPEIKPLELMLRPERKRDAKLHTMGVCARLGRALTIELPLGPNIDRISLCSAKCATLSFAFSSFLRLGCRSAICHETVYLTDTPYYCFFSFMISSTEKKLILPSAPPMQIALMSSM